jgi:hypothetical protein
MKKALLNELNQMKYLFGYKPGRVISEQEINEAQMEMSDVEFDFPEVAPAPDKEKTKEKETEERPKRRGLPSRNPDDLPNVDPHPQGRGDEEIEYELELDEPEMEFDMDEPEMDVDMEVEDEPMISRRRRFSRD